MARHIRRGVFHLCNSFLYGGLYCHLRCEEIRLAVHCVEHALRRCLALRVGLGLDRLHVGGAGREALAQHGNAASGGGARNHNDGVAAHRLGCRVQKGRR